MPQVRGCDHGQRPLLLLEALSGCRWPPPWDATGVDRVLAAPTSLRAADPGDARCRRCALPRAVSAGAGGGTGRVSVLVCCSGACGPRDFEANRLNSEAFNARHAVTQYMKVATHFGHVGAERIDRVAQALHLHLDRATQTRPLPFDLTAQGRPLPTNHRHQYGQRRGYRSHRAEQNGNSVHHGTGHTATGLVRSP